MSIGFQKVWKGIKMIPKRILKDLVRNPIDSQRMFKGLPNGEWRQSNLKLSTLSRSNDLARNLVDFQRSCKGFGEALMVVSSN